jgi:Uma2 family endonuclease
MATQTALTLDQFLALPETEDGTHYELSEGELITLPPPGFRHGVILMNVGGILRASLDRKKYIITGGDAGFILKTDPQSATVRGADVAVTDRESLGTIPETGYLSQAPMLAVEVVSPSNTAADLERKINEYLSAGALEVWLLYPDTHRLHVYRAHGEAKIFQAHDRFQSLLGPEFDVPAFFEN